MISLESSQAYPEPHRKKRKFIYDDDLDEKYPEDDNYDGLNGEEEE